MKTVVRFFDELEDRVRGWFSHRPISYAFLGGVAVILFWRGVWHSMDSVMHAVSLRLGFLPWWDGPLSLLIGTVLLLLIGVFVSNFIGNEIIISGLKHEKKLVERTESEVRDEVHAIDDVRREVEEIRERLATLECGPAPEGKGRKTSGRA